jgi:hypothetical protein
VLPGHGERVHLPANKMHQQLSKLLNHLGVPFGGDKRLISNG